MQNPLFYLLLAFFLGSLPFGHWLALRLGVDLRKQGSGNTGATNVSRVLGKKWGYLVFALDFTKGWIPVVLAIHAGNLSDSWVVGTGVCAVLGHVFSPWLGFRGGKGVATSAGILIGLTPSVSLGGRCDLVDSLSIQSDRLGSLPERSHFLPNSSRMVMPPTNRTPVGRSWYGRAGLDSAS